MLLPFQGRGRAMSSEGLAATAAVLNTRATELFTVISVETKGCGFLPDRRPQILYERHIFHRLTKTVFLTTGTSAIPGPAAMARRAIISTNDWREQSSKTARPHCKVLPGASARSWAKTIAQRASTVSKRWLTA